MITLHAHTCTCSIEFTIYIYYNYLSMKSLFDSLVFTLVIITNTKTKEEIIKDVYI